MAAISSTRSVAVKADVHDFLDDHLSKLLEKVTVCTNRVVFKQSWNDFDTDAPCIDATAIVLPLEVLIRATHEEVQAFVNASVRMLVTTSSAPSLDPDKCFERQYEITIAKDDPHYEGSIKVASLSFTLYGAKMPADETCLLHFSESTLKVIPEVR